MGRWLQTTGDSIYGTRGGPVPARSWGVSTQSATQVFLHVLDWPDNLLPVPAVNFGRNLRILATGEAVRTTVVDDQLILHLPAKARDPIDTIIVWDK